MSEDPLLRLLARLPDHASNSVRGERVRARCHAVLTRNRRSGKVDSPAPAGLWRVAAALACAYGAETIRQALRVYGIL